MNELSIVLLSTLDIMLMNMFVGAQASGEYSLVKMLPTFIQRIVAVLVGVFVLQFTIYYAKGQREKLLESIMFSIKVMGALITIPIGFLIIFGGDFYHLWVPNQNESLLQGLSVFTLIPMVVTGSMNTIFNVYTVTNKLKTPALVWLGLGVVNVVMVIGLLKFTPLGIWTIPIVSLIMGLARNLTFTPIYASYCLHVHWTLFYMAILRGCGCVLSIMAISMLYRMVHVPNGWFGLIFAAVVCGSLALCVNVIIAFNKAERGQFIDLVRSKFAKKLRKA